MFLNNAPIFRPFLMRDNDTYWGPGLKLFRMKQVDVSHDDEVHQHGFGVLKKSNKISTKLLFELNILQIYTQQLRGIVSLTIHAFFS